MSRTSRDTLTYIANSPYLANLSLPNFIDSQIDSNNFGEKNLLESNMVVSKKNLYLSNFNLEAEKLFYKK